MEIRVENNPNRTFEYTKKKVLKDGTIREYKYTRAYTTKTNRVECGKVELTKRLSNCQNKEKIERIKQFFDELEI